jgi:TATA-box binding protein (TBP) (component of TFIID and TFIIIB)
MSLDDEWCNFLDNDSSNDDLDDNNLNYRINKENTENIENIENIENTGNTENDNNIIPKCSDIYISTKTKIIFLSQPIDIYNLFWIIPINDYHIQKTGIIKKQIKLTCINKTEVENIDKKLENINYFTNKIINHIDNPDGRVKFKDIRKISIGLSKKDLLSSRVKDKGAFHNCFVLTIRLLVKNSYKEFHVKIFNTGKMEIPGIQDEEIFIKLLNTILDIFKIYVNENIYIHTDKIENVLINSNFNCGFYINREKLYNILRTKYKINAGYDPCSYPGIQCVYYHSQTNKNESEKTKNKISYMIFRTGSILIVGKCSENILMEAYHFVKNILLTEFKNIYTSLINTNTIKEKNTITNSKINNKKKTIYVNM